MDSGREKMKTVRVVGTDVSLDATAHTQTVTNIAIAIDFRTDSRHLGEDGIIDSISKP